MGNWEANVRHVIPYTPGEQPKRDNIIKLNTNENPYPPAPGVAEALRAIDAGKLRRYPDPAVADLVHAIADCHGVEDSQVFVGVGSDDVLAMIFLTFFNGEKSVLFPDITYSFYDVWAELFRVPCEQVPLDEAFRLRPADYMRENGGIIFPNPNAPTGELMPLSDVETILKGNPDVIVVVDEAYIDFGGESALPLLARHDNLIVTRTFSKSRSMAGSRIGYAIGSPKVIRYLNDVKYSFNSYTMDSVTIALGVAALDPVYLQETTARIVRTREWTKGELRRLGFVFGDSRANFIFARHPKLSGEALFLALKEEGIYVRHFSKPERIREYLRITVGTDEEMHSLIGFLEGYVTC